MSILVKSVLVADPKSSHNKKVRDILIEGGRIVSIKAKIKDENAKTFDGKNLVASPGWIDMAAHFGDPGEEFKEDLKSGVEAAKAAGFSGVVLMPNTSPPIDSKSSVEYLINRGANGYVDIYPTGMISKGGNGKNLSEYFDMHQAGAVAFTDDHQYVNSTDLMYKSLEYAKNFNGLIMSMPFDPDLNPEGVMNEGATSTFLGLKGIPHASEEIRLHRDIELLRYSGSRMHVSLISTAGSVDMIRKAKKDGLSITCGVSHNHLFFEDKDLEGYDTNLKNIPPFRTNADRKALLRGLEDGTIDVICTDHRPEDIENKKLEFNRANFGVASMESFFPVLNEVLKTKMKWDGMINAIAHNPRAILGLEPVSIEEGSISSLTIFNPTSESKLKRFSKAYNNPFEKMELKGNVEACIKGNKLHRV